MLRLFRIFCCFSIFVLSACSERQNIVSMSDKEVYFFYQNSCMHCHSAAQYIKEKHPNMKIKALDVKMPGNMRLLESAAITYNLGDTVGTPLICFGKNYIMGWSENDAEKLDYYARKYEE